MEKRSFSLNNKQHLCILQQRVHISFPLSTACIQNSCKFHFFFFLLYLPTKSMQTQTPVQTCRRIICQTTAHCWKKEVTINILWLSTSREWICFPGFPDVVITGPHAGQRPDSTSVSLLDPQSSPLQTGSWPLLHFAAHFLQN